MIFECFWNIWFLILIYPFISLGFTFSSCISSQSAIRLFCHHSWISMLGNRVSHLSTISDSVGWISVWILFSLITHVQEIFKLDDLIDIVFIKMRNFFHFITCARAPFSIKPIKYYWWSIRCVLQGLASYFLWYIHKIRLYSKYV